MDYLLQNRHIPKLSPKDYRPLQSINDTSGSHEATGHLDKRQDDSGPSAAQPQNDVRHGEDIRRKKLQHHAIINPSTNQSLSGVQSVISSAIKAADATIGHGFPPGTMMSGFAQERALWEKARWNLERTRLLRQGQYHDLQTPAPPAPMSISIEDGAHGPAAIALACLIMLIFLVAPFIPWLTDRSIRANQQGGEEEEVELHDLEAGGFFKMLVGDEWDEEADEDEIECYVEQDNREWIGSHLFA